MIGFPKSGYFLKTIYFSPLSDPFQPVPEVLDMTYHVFKFLLESQVGVAFVTKGRIPERQRKLLAPHASLVQGRIGLTRLDPGIAASVLFLWSAAVGSL